MKHASYVFAIFATLSFTFISVTCRDGSVFQDSVMYNINWPGDKIDNLELGDEYMTVVSSHQEQYKCYLPNVKRNSHSDVKYEGPSVVDLLEPLLFAKLPCSFRIESYWSYEVCHGRYVRQYHEAREGKTVRVQEFNLGKWDPPQMLHVLNELKKKEPTENTQIPTKKIDGYNLPYIEVTMGNGTLCELNDNKPRQTTIFYVCYVHGRNEIFSFKESSICTYEVIVLTPLLCAHPKYKSYETGENNIHCIPDGDSPKKPRNLLKLNYDSRKLRAAALQEQVQVEFTPFVPKASEKLPPETPVDTSPVESFLSGRNCLVGGAGWWKYEFCYGKSVEQYHIEKDGSKTSINLGIFNLEKHLEWIESHPHKRPKPVAQRTQLSHHYSGGSICDKTGNARQTEVKLKCLEKASSQNTVSLYLLEPRYCEYILGVESPLICDILARADENGLVESANDEEVTIRV